MINIRLAIASLHILLSPAFLFGQSIVELKPKGPVTGEWNLNVKVPAGSAFEVQSSQDLTSWSALVPHLMGTGFEQLINIPAHDQRARFFRLAQKMDTGVYTLGSRVPEAGESGVERMIYISTGQSLAIGGEGTPVLSSTQDYGNKTFSGGPRSTTSQWGAAGPLVEVDGSPPAVDWWGATGRGETPCSGACNGWEYLAERLDPSNPGSHWFAFSAGRGGTKLLDLLPGSRNYQELYLPMLAASRSLADTAGVKSAVYVIAFRQGESDSTGKVSYAQYRESLETFRNASMTDADSITGQSFKPLFLCWQPQVATLTHADIAVAMWDACRQSDEMVLAGPQYYQASKVGLHFTAAGYRTAGRYDAKISWLWFHEKKRWRPLEPVSCVINGSNVDLRYRVPVPPLCIDSTSLGEIPQKGFAVRDAGSASSPIAIRSVDITGPDSIRLTCSRPVDPVTYAVRYGLDYNRPNFPLVPLASSGAGCIRDSDDFAIEGEALPNWSVQFSVNSTTF